MDALHRDKHADAGDYIDAWRAAGDAAGQVIARAIREQLQDCTIREQVQDFRQILQRFEPLLTLLKNV